VLAEWLASYRVTPVGMESTGCNWKPLWHLLEDQVGCWLLNVHLHNVLGRKTDIADAAWIAQPVDTAGQPPVRRHLRQGWQEHTVRSAVRSYVLCTR
jgi:hypothetical protein